MKKESFSYFINIYLILWLRTMKQLSLKLVAVLTQPQTPFIFLRFEVAADKITLELSSKILLSETNLNYVNTKARRVYLLVKKTNM